MRTFMATHTLPPNAVSLEQVQTLSRLAQQDAVVKGRHAYGNLSEGKVVCILDAPNREALAEFFERNHMPVDSIVPVEFEGEGGTVRRT